MTTDNQDYSLHNLASNPNFDLIKSFTKDQEDPEDPHNHAPDSPYEISNFYCSYTDPLSFRTTYHKSDKFSIMSLNIQCLSSKFCDLKVTDFERS